MGLRLVSAAESLAVTLVEAKAHLKVEHSDDDSLIGIYLGAAIDELDGSGGYLGRALVDQAWDLTLDEFPDDDAAIVLPLPPLIEVVGVYYQATAGSETTLDADDYVVSGIGDRAQAGRVSLPATGTWPNLAEVANAVRVRFRAGYIDPSDSPAANTAVPAAIKAAILLRVGDLYRNRGSAAHGDSVAAFPWTKGLLRRHKFYLSAA